MTWLLPVPASAHAGEIDTIMLLVHALMFALAFGWGAIFLYTLVRFRRSRQPRADYQGAKSRFSTHAEIAIVAAELILLVGFSIPAWATRVRDVPTSDDVVAIRVVAEQFAWNVHYPGQDRVFGRTDVSLVAADNPLGLDASAPSAADDVTTINEIVVPLGRPVVVQLNAKDVIHSFGVPAMRIKQDATPGMTTTAWFTPTRLGEFEVACSQLCGLGHYRMRAVLRVVEPAEYVRWLSGASGQR